MGDESLGIGGGEVGMDGDGGEREPGGGIIREGLVDGGGRSRT